MNPLIKRVIFFFFCRGKHDSDRDGKKEALPKMGDEIKP